MAQVDRAFRTTVEATEIIRKLWNGQQVDHSGPYYKVNARLYDPPTQSIPLLMAGNGPKAMRRCGQYADGLITDPKTWKEHTAEFQKGASDAGKDPTRMPEFAVHDQKYFNIPRSPPWFFPDGIADSGWPCGFVSMF
jgi:alkanesulfonate monooxygenase SsuD/methylene tetrahydromethanopterin reductase-like flavin-dependent oxidoreductase (luciferase family)